MARKLMKKSRKTRQKGGRHTRKNRNSAETLNIPSIYPCPNNTTEECYQYPENSGAYYHQAQFYPDEVGKDASTCTLQTINNFLGRIEYNQPKIASWIDLFYKNIDHINDVIVTVEPYLRKLYYIEDDDFTLFSNNYLHALNKWPQRYNAYREDPNNKIFSDNLENYDRIDKETSFDYLEAWWLLSFRKQNDTLVFFPMHLDTIKEVPYKSLKITNYFTIRNPRPPKFFYGDGLTGHSYLIHMKTINSSKKYIRVNSMIWRKNYTRTNLNIRQPDFTSTLDRRSLDLDINTFLFQLHDTSSELNREASLKLMTQIMDNRNEAELIPVEEYNFNYNFQNNQNNQNNQANQENE